jgi:hypothetical protein
LNLLDRFLKNIQISNFMKIHPLGDELFHAGRQTHGQTHKLKLHVACHNFANTPKNASYIHISGVEKYSFPSSNNATYFHQSFTHFDMNEEPDMHQFLQILSASTSVYTHEHPPWYYTCLANQDFGCHPTQFGRCH